MTAVENTAYDTVANDFKASTTRDPPTIVSSESTTRGIDMLPSFNVKKILYPMPSPSGWSGLTSFDMIEGIAKMAIKSSKLMTLDTESSEYSFLRYLSNQRDIESHGDLSESRKRKHLPFKPFSDGDSYYCDDGINGCEFVPLPEVEISNLLLNPWKPSTVLDYQKQNIKSQMNGDGVLTQLSHLDSIVSNFEQLIIQPENKWCIPSYNRVQLMFSSGITTRAEDGVVCHLLHQAIQQMNSLMTMITSPVAPANRVKFTKFVSCNDGTKQLMSRPNPIRIMNDIVLPESSLSEKEKRKVFNAYLTEWMCQSRNWINPYPDETLLRQMASHFIHLGCVPGVDGVVSETEAIGKINTWLLNTRARHWRPSVEEAFDGKRPAMLLMEDSMRIFKGDKLRPMIGWNSETIFAGLCEYAVPIADWGKKGSEVVTSKKSDSTGSAKSAPQASHDKILEMSNDVDYTSLLFPQAQTALTETLDEFGLMEGNELFDLLGDDAD